jgi:hypothetical protein
MRPSVHIGPAERTREVPIGGSRLGRRDLAADHTHQGVDELAQGIKQRGGILAMEPTDGPLGQRVFRMRDPDGFKYPISSAHHTLSQEYVDEQPSIRPC